MKMKMIATAAVALALLAVMGIFAVASTVTYSNPASGTVTAQATVNPRIELTITTPDPAQTVNFGLVDPGTSHTDTVTVGVRSNVLTNLTSSMGGSHAEIGLTRSLANQALGRGVTNLTDIYTINVPWATEPNTYTASVLYTVTQQ